MRGFLRKQHGSLIFGACISLVLVVRSLRIFESKDLPFDHRNKEAVSQRMLIASQKMGQVPCPKPSASTDFDKDFFYFRRGQTLLHACFSCSLKNFLLFIIGKIRCVYRDRIVVHRSGNQTVPCPAPLPILNQKPLFTSVCSSFVTSEECSKVICLILALSITPSTSAVTRACVSRAEILWNFAPNRCLSRSMDS